MSAKNEIFYKFKDWIVDNNILHDYPKIEKLKEIEIKELKNIGDEYRYWYNDFGKIKKISLELEKKILSFERCNNKKFHLIVSIGQSGLPLAYCLSKKLKKKLAVFSKGSYQFFMKRVLKPNLFYIQKNLEGNNGEINVCIIDSVLKSGLSARISLDFINKAKNYAKAKMGDLAIFTVILNYNSFKKEFFKDQHDVYFNPLYINDEEVNQSSQTLQPFFGLDPTRIYNLYKMSIPDFSYTINAIATSPMTDISEKSNPFIDPDLKLNDTYLTDFDEPKNIDFLFKHEKNRIAIIQQYRNTFKRNIPKWQQDEPLIDANNAILIELKKNIQNLKNNKSFSYRDFIINIKKNALKKKQENKPIEEIWNIPIYISLLIDKIINAFLNIRPEIFNKNQLKSNLTDLLNYILSFLDNLNSKNDIKIDQFIEEITKLINFFSNLFDSTYEKSMLKLTETASQGDHLKLALNIMFKWFENIDHWSILQNNKFLDTICSNIYNDINNFKFKNVILLPYRLSGILISLQIAEKFENQEKKKIKGIHYFLKNEKILPKLIGNDIIKKDFHETCFIIISSNNKIISDLYLPIKLLKENLSNFNIRNGQIKIYTIFDYGYKIFEEKPIETEPGEDEIEIKNYWHAPINFQYIKLYPKKDSSSYVDLILNKDYKKVIRYENFKSDSSEGKINSKQLSELV